MNDKKILLGLGALIAFLFLSSRAKAKPLTAGQEEPLGGGGGGGIGGFGSAPPTGAAITTGPTGPSEYEIFVKSIKLPEGMPIVTHLANMGMNYAGATAQYIMFTLKLSKEFAIAQISSIYGIDKSTATYIANNTSAAPTDLAKALYNLGYSIESNAVNVSKAFQIPYDKAYGVISTIYPTVTPKLTTGGTGILGVSVGSGSSTPKVSGPIVSL